MVDVHSIECDLKIPCDYLKKTSRLDWFEAVLHHDWLRKITETFIISEFPSHEKLTGCEVQAQLVQGGAFALPWLRSYIKVLKKKDKLVLPLAKSRSNPEDKSSSQLTYSQILHYVALTNYKNLWKEACKKSSDDILQLNAEENVTISFTKYNNVLRDIIQRTYDCQIVNLCSSSTPTVPGKQTSQTHRNILPVLGVIESNLFFYIIQDASLVHTVQDSVNLSPALLGSSYSKPLFLIYQLLQIARWLHDRGLVLGNILLSDIFISDDLWIQVCPRLEDNICLQNLNEETSVLLLNSSKQIENSCDTNGFEQIDLGEMTLNQACKEWVMGNISNFDYLMLLNKLAGRKFGDPKCHYIFPWVSDFSSRSGNNFRDLTKSKYRLNKGDRQLDLTFDVSNSSSSKQIPHHISDVLSEITYYIYLSRRMPKNILCQHVRTKWVPAEYPSSIQRLQTWTPDECIPEFFSDASVFKSIHVDLPDLEVPPWATDFDDFIKWHRSILENDFISEKLNLWIDLTFGYKLSGNAAVKSKNVCLQLVDNHTSLTLSGIIQLFTQPHPQKLTTSLYYYNNVPLRIFASQKNKIAAENSSNDDTHSDDLDESFDSQTSIKSSSSSLALSKFLSRSRNSLSTAVTPDATSLSNNDKISYNPEIFLPHDYNPLQLLSAVESLLSFINKTWHGTIPDLKNLVNSQKEESNLDSVPSCKAETFKLILSNQRVNEMYVLCCIIVEIFCALKLRVFGSISNDIELKDRISICKSVYDVSTDSFPFCVRNLVSVLFSGKDMDSLIFPAVTHFGVPPPSAHRLLIPNLSLNLLPFPSYVITAYDLSKLFHELFTSDNRNDELVENYIKIITNELDKVTDCYNNNDNFAHLLLPNIIRLFDNPSTRIIAIWYLFDRVGKLLGIKETQKHLSDIIIQLYNFDNCLDSEFFVVRMNKYLKFYHRNFILCLIIRFGFKMFLENLITPLVEAVGCYRDLVCNKLSCNRNEVPKFTPNSEKCDEKKLASNKAKICKIITSNKEITKGNISLSNLDHENLDIEFGIETSDSLDCAEGDGMEENFAFLDSKMKFSETAADTLIWLSNRIGPVLTAKYITRNLLRMLTLSYSDVNNLELIQKTEDECVHSTVTGDELSVNILKCLTFCVTLYGENFIILQYLPHISDIVQLCQKNKITPNLESGLVGSLVLLKHVISYVPEEQLSNILEETLCDNILYPCLIIITSKNVKLPNEIISRVTLVHKFIDIIFVLSLLISPKQLHVTSPVLQTFFQCFSHCNPSKKDDIEEDSPNFDDSIYNNFKNIFSPKLAFTVFNFFTKHFSESFMERIIVNYSFIKNICDEYRKVCKTSSGINIDSSDRCIDSADASSTETSCSFGKSVTITGNRINLYENENNSNNPCIWNKSNENTNKQRHLYGNWLAYWEYELNQLNPNFTLNQIKLQQFNSHQSNIKALCVLDNENSFLSASRDKTVKIWSIHNEGDGNHVSTCQWTYSSHKKSVMSLTFVDKHRLVASTDANVHLWDPFLGISLNQIGTYHCVNTIKSISSSTSNVLAANTDACVLVLDTRLAQYVSELKVSTNPIGLIRCIAVSPCENWIAVGQTSGFLTVLDLRTGMIIRSWKAHEGEILQVVAFNDYTLISSSLDQTVSVWNVVDGKLKTNIKGPLEPVHCMALFNNQLISGTTANKIGVHSSLNSGAVFSSTKLKVESFKGLLTSMALLPLSRLLLLGSDNGSITLIC